MLRNIRKIIVNEINSACIALQPLPGYFQDLAVPVKSDDPDIRETSPETSSECPPFAEQCSPPVLLFPDAPNSLRNGPAHPALPEYAYSPRQPLMYYVALELISFPLRRVPHASYTARGRNPCRSIFPDRPQERSVNPGPAGTGCISPSPRSRSGRSGPEW